MTFIIVLRFVLTIFGSREGFSDKTFFLEVAFWCIFCTPLSMGIPIRYCIDVAVRYCMFSCRVSHLNGSFLKLREPVYWFVVFFVHLCYYDELIVRS